MGLQRAINTLVLADVPNDDSTFFLGETDKIDITAYNADARLELHDGMRWLSGVTEAIRIRRGLHKPVGGLATAYQWSNGVRGFRLSNWTKGSVATVDLEAYSVG